MRREDQMMMFAFAGFMAGIVPWMTLGWIMRGDSYTRHRPQAMVPSPPEPWPAPVAPLPAPVAVAPVVHIHLPPASAQPAWAPLPVRAPLMIDGSEW
ncbi:MAG: hypothetical protein ACRDSH_19240 [Pseudonocardiaceae bacterium]